jgi:hypothetical protein
LTTVNLKYRRIDGVAPEGALVTSGLVEVTPAYRTDTGSGQLTTITQTFVVGSSITLAGGTYLFKLRASDGHGGRLKDEGVYRLVPASGTFDVDDLTEVTPSASGMSISDVQALIDAAIAGIVAGSPTGSGPGGAFVIADVTDSTTVGKAVVKAVDAAAGRTAISAAAATHTHVATTDLTATGTKNTTTFLRGDNTWAAPPAAGSPAWTDITGKPTTFTPSTHTHVVTDIVGESTPVGNLLSAADAAGARAAIGAADGATTALIRVPWRQIGSTYPTPMPTGFYGFDFEGQLDPRTQAGITVNPNTDKWTQLP